MYSRGTLAQAPLVVEVLVTALAEPPMPEERRTLMPEEFLYTPARVESILRRWGEIYALAMNPYTARGLVKPNVETRDAPRFKSLKHNYHGDSLTWAALVGDIERAWYRLLGEGQDPQARLRWTIVAHRMAGRKMAEIALACHVRTEVVVAEHKKACLEMARVLGYVEPAENMANRE